MGGCKQLLVLALACLTFSATQAASRWTVVDEDEHIVLSIDEQTVVSNAESVIVEVLIVYKQPQTFEQPDGTTIPYTASAGPFFFGCKGGKFGVGKRATLYQSAGATLKPVATFVDESVAGKFLMQDTPPSATLQKIARLLCE